MWDYKCDNCGATLDPGEQCDCDERDEVKEGDTKK